MPRTIWTKLLSEANGNWTRHEGEPPFTIPAVGGQTYDVQVDTGESLTITSLTNIVAPSLSGTPTLTGTAQIGQTLTASAAPSSGTTPITTSWQWLRNGTDISGATNASHALVAADESTNISVRQTDSNTAGTDSAVSPAMAVQSAPANGAAVITNVTASDQAANGVVNLSYMIDTDSAVSGVLTRSATPPTTAQILAGQDHTGTAASSIFTDNWIISGSDTLPDISNNLTFDTYYVHVLPSGGADSDVATSNGFILETVLPMVSSASVNAAGTSLTITMSEAVSGAAVTGNWIVSGTSASATSVTAISDTTTITLTLSPAVANGDTVLLAYSGGNITDAVSNALANFTGLAVTNNVSSASSLDVTYVSQVVAPEVDATAYNCDGMAIGVAAADRDIYAVVQAGRRQVTAVTIAGVSATLVIASGTNYLPNTIWKARITTGTTADVDVTLASASGSSRVMTTLFRVTGLIAETDTAFIDETAAVPSISGTINVGDGGVVILAGSERGGGNGLGFTGATLVGSVQDLDSGDHGGVALETGLASETGRPLQVSFGSNTGNLALVAISLE